MPVTDTTPSHLRPRIALVTTGGTIASVGHDRLDLAFYGATGEWLELDQLVERVPELDELAEIVPVPYARMGSSSITTGDWLRLAATVNGLLADDDIGGVVITHGTNTIEETAYFLSLVTPQAKPTIIVGAMRPASALSADGDLNLVEAVRAAAAPGLRDHGTLVAMAGEIFDAKHVTKGHTHRPDAFTAGRHGPVASIAPTGEVVVHRAPPEGGRHDARFDVAGRDDLPRVDIALSYACQDGRAIRAMVRDGARIRSPCHPCRGRGRRQRSLGSGSGLSAISASVVSSRPRSTRRSAAPNG
jgi:L-asparaginase